MKAIIVLHYPILGSIHPHHPLQRQLYKTSKTSILSLTMTVILEPEMICLSDVSLHLYIMFPTSLNDVTA
jgi:hypothetical protein